MRLSGLGGRGLVAVRFRGNWILSGNPQQRKALKLETSYGNLTLNPKAYVSPGEWTWAGLTSAALADVRKAQHKLVESPIRSSA